MHRNVLLTVALCGALLLGPFAPAAAASGPEPFSDIAGSFAEEQIRDLQNRGILTGKSPGRFDPHASITRAEFMTMLTRTLNIQPVDGAIPAFSDVPRQYWSYASITAGTALGIASGVAPASFAPEQPINREEAATLMVRAIKAAGQGGDQDLHFPDAALISPWARPFVAAASALGLMAGDESGFRPGSSITREETAAVLYRMLQKLDWLNAVPVSAFRDQVQLAWQFMEENDAFQQRVARSKFINTVSPRWFFLEAGGLVKDVAEPSLVTWSHQQGKQVWALFGNRFDRAMSHAFLVQPEQRASVTDQLAELLATYHVDGINVDFENLDPADRELFTAFIAELTAAMHEKKISVSVDVPPDLGSDWSDPYDYKALGEAADYVVLMGYDEHWTGGPRAGSVSSLPWLTEALRRLTSQVTAEKVIAGMPLYTREWYVSGGKLQSQDVLLPQQADLVRNTGASLEWLPDIGQYQAVFWQNGVPHQMWVEDARSLSLKLDMALEQGVGGAAFWHMGGETRDVWDGLKNVRNYRLAMGEPGEPS